MSITVNFYTFRKRDNSTKRVSGNGTSFQCKLKDACGVVSPTLEILTSMSSAPIVYNYCYIPTFDRYYFVKEWTYSNRLWVAELNEDVLASWKDTIGASSEYVLRSSVASAINGSITDTLFPATTNAYIGSNAIRMNPNQADYMNFDLGEFVLGVVNSDVSSRSGISYYVLSGASMASLRSFMLDSGVTSWDDIGAFTGDIAKAVLDPFQYITSCMWFPYTSLGASLGATTTLKFGFWDSGVSARPLLGYDMRYSQRLTRPVSPVQMVDEYNYHEPFASYQIELQPFGIIPLEDGAITGHGVVVGVVIDLISGEGRCSVYASDADGVTTALLAQRVAQIGVPVAITQQSIDIGGSVSGLVHGVTSAFTGGIANAITDIGSSIVGAVAPKVSASGGGKGGAMVVDPYCTFRAFYSHIPFRDIANSGAPCCRTYQLSTIPGYIKCLHGDIGISGTLEEARAVKNYLENGFFYE